MGCSIIAAAVGKQDSLVKSLARRTCRNVSSSSAMKEGTGWPTSDAGCKITKGIASDFAPGDAKSLGVRDLCHTGPAYSRPSCTSGNFATPRFTLTILQMKGLNKYYLYGVLPGTVYLDTR
ncbi:hypothetical protein Bbelb_391430 [Branchiostoma belcheri]|nr:hypothetical protein Bbelb_391430 [Branchiostoma belcheri]